RLSICTSIAERYSPSRGSSSGDLQNSPTIPHIRSPLALWRFSTQLTTSPTARLRAVQHRGRQTSRPRYGSFLHALEAGQVLGDLPGGDLLVVPEPLVTLHARVVVDVVLATPVAESLAQDVVGLELADRLQQVPRQRP